MVPPVRPAAPPEDHPEFIQEARTLPWVARGSTLLVDLLPAGFEIENASLEGGRNTEELSWLGDLTETRHTELRDDRYVAALQFNRYDDRSFRLAYTVRAVSPGTYRLPAAYVEDMYEPVFFARSRMGKVTIRSAQ